MGTRRGPPRAASAPAAASVSTGPTCPGSKRAQRAEPRPAPLSPPCVLVALRATFGNQRCASPAASNVEAKAAGDVREFVARKYSRRWTDLYPELKPDMNADEKVGAARVKHCGPKKTPACWAGRSRVRGAARGGRFLPLPQRPTGMIVATAVKDLVLIGLAGIVINSQLFPPS